MLQYRSLSDVKHLCHFSSLVCQTISAEPAGRLTTSYRPLLLAFRFQHVGNFTLEIWPSVSSQMWCHDWGTHNGKICSYSASRVQIFLPHSSWVISTPQAIATLAAPWLRCRNPGAFPCRNNPSPYYQTQAQTQGTTDLAQGKDLWTPR